MARAASSSMRPASRSAISAVRCADEHVAVQLREHLGALACAPRDRASRRRLANAGRSSPDLGQRGRGSMSWRRVRQRNRASTSSAASCARSARPCVPQRRSATWSVGESDRLQPTDQQRQRPALDQQCADADHERDGLNRRALGERLAGDVVSRDAPTPLPASPRRACLSTTPRRSPAMSVAGGRSRPTTCRPCCVVACRARRGHRRRERAR